MGKNTPQRRIDTPREGGGARDADIQSVQGSAVLGAPLIDTPSDLTWVTTYIDISDYTPLATVELSWRYDAATPPDVFLIQWSTSASFTPATTVTVAGTVWTATLRGLPTDTVLYIRVAARRSGVVSPWSAAISGTTASDATPLAAVTGASVSWNIATGDVTITWTPPSDTRYKHTVVTIRNASTNAVLRSVTAVAGRYVWTYAQQVQDTAGSFVFSLRVELQPVTTRNVAGAMVQVTASAPSLSAPSGLTTSWAGDTGTAEADCLISWNHVPGARHYDVTINGTTRSVGYVDRYAYSYEQNRRENGGSGAPSLSITVTARDVYNRSAATTTTATNAAPPAPNIPSLQAFFSSMRLTWTATTARDARHYLLELQRNNTTVATYTLAPGTTTYTYDVQQSGTHRARLAVVDVFNQQSSWSGWSTTAELTNDTEFVQNLRSSVVYADSVGTNPSALNVLKDAVTASGGISYSASSGWYWIRCDHGREIRHRTTTLAVALTSVSAYLSVSNDGATWSWYAGGTVGGTVWTPVAQTTEANAQGAAVTLFPGVYRVQLPTPVQTRFIRLHFRNTSATVRIDEFYPRALVQSDDIEAEAIRAVHVAAASITADKLNVNNLSAISANLGSVTAGSITGVTITGTTITGSTITGTTITGATITGGVFQTSASLPRIEIDGDGLRYRDDTNSILVEIGTTGPNPGWLAANTIIAGKLYLSHDIQFNSFYPGAPFLFDKIDATIFGFFLDAGSYLTGIFWDAYASISLRHNQTSFLVRDNDMRLVANTITCRPSTSAVSSLEVVALSGYVGDVRLGRTTSLGGSGAPRWTLRLGTDDNFFIIAHDNSGSGLHTVLAATRLTGYVGFGGSPDVAGGAAGSIDVYGDARIRGRLRAQTDWTSITLENNWEDCGNLTGDPSVAYRIMPDGTVQFRGAIRRTSGSSPRIFTMPTALQGSVVRRMVVSFRVSSTSVFQAAQLSYYPLSSHGVFFDGASIVNSSGTTVEGIVSLWGTWNLLG